MTDKEINKIEKNKKVTHCYIRKGGQGYYRPGSCGYTDFTTRAGVYTKAEAIEHARSCRDLTIPTIDIDYHNKCLLEEIQSMASRLILNSTTEPKDGK